MPWCLDLCLARMSRASGPQLFSSSEPFCSSHPPRQTSYYFALTTSLNILAIQSLFTKPVCSCIFTMREFGSPVFRRLDQLKSPSPNVQLYNSIQCFCGHPNGFNQNYDLRQCPFPSFCFIISDLRFRYPNYDARTCAF